MKKQKKRVLVVEDNPVLLSLWGRLLNDMGVKDALFTNDSIEARALLHKYDFELMISDIILPKVNGYNLAKYAKNLNPEIEILLTTGYDTNLKRFDLKGLRAHLVHKPYHNIEKLIAIICHLLDKSNPFSDADEDSYSGNDDYPEITEWTL